MSGPSVTPEVEERPRWNEFWIGDAQSQVGYIQDERALELSMDGLWEERGWERTRVLARRRE
jgi:hypothetical protein